MKSFSHSGRDAAARTSGRRHLRRNALAASVIAVAGALSLSVSALAATPVATDLPTQSAAYNSAWQPAPYGYQAPADDGLGTKPGQVGHVWVIMLENHAYSQSFTPLEGTQSSYLQQLPSQGALLTQYYGTGHSSLDNYVAATSGQAPQADDQSDCANYSAMDGSVDTSGTPATNADYGQLKSNAGPDAPPGDNGCVYPSSVKTIFNQLQSAGKSWKVYAQDLGGGFDLNGNPTGTHANQDAGNPTTNPVSSSNPYDYAACGAPDPSVAEAPDQNGSYDAPAAGAGSTANTNFASTSNSTTDTYVAKHNPLAWFSAITGTADTSGGTIDSSLCNPQHLGALFGPQDALYNDLQNPGHTPDFSFIVPDNCSDGHDALCVADNLSGGTSNGYTNGTIEPATSNTGGTVAESDFLKIVIPEIEKSPAFKQNGMIVVTYDEAYPPFVYSSDTQTDSQLQSADAMGSLSNDAPGETLFGRSLNWEPTGPNATVVHSALSGQVLSGGPGDSAYLDLPTSADGDLVACPSPKGGGASWQTFTTPTPTNGVCEPGYQANGYHPTSASVKVDLTSGSSLATEAATEGSLSPSYDGDATNLTGSFEDSSGNPYTGTVYFGQVTNEPNDGTSTTATEPYTSSVQLVQQNGSPLTYEGTSATQQAVALTAATDSANDPFFDPYDATLGGGDAGAVVISPYVKPGTVSNTYYNHYSLLRTVEDVFGEQGNGSNDLTYGVSPGSTTQTGTLNGPYLGFAGQPGLAPFGSDVFTNPAGYSGVPYVNPVHYDPGHYWGRGIGYKPGHKVSYSPVHKPSPYKGHDVGHDKGPRR